MLTDNFFWNFPPKEGKEFFEKLGTEAYIVLDTNILLNLYTYKESSSGEILSFLEAFSNRVWIPYQVGLEFTRNIRSVILRNMSDSHKVISNARKLMKADEEISIKINCIAPVEKFVYEENKRLKLLIEKEGEKISHFNSLLENDTLLPIIEKLVGLNIGTEISKEEQLEIYKEGARRFEDKVPPGFGDASKEGSRQYGDLVIWKEILKFAKEGQKSIIFITNDHKKNDWFYLENKKPIAPHFLLRKEFNEVVESRYFWMYTLSDFLHYGERWQQNYRVDDDVIAEVKKSDYDKTISSLNKWLMIDDFNSKYKSFYKKLLDNKHIYDDYSHHILKMVESAIPQHDYHKLWFDIYQNITEQNKESKLRCSICDSPLGPDDNGDICNGCRCQPSLISITNE